MKRIWLLCLLLIIPFCFIGCGNSNEYITRITRNMYEFEADKDYNLNGEGISIYFTVKGDETEYKSITYNSIYYDYVTTQGYTEWHIAKGDKIRFRLVSNDINLGAVEINTIKIASNEDESIYYEQVINEQVIN